ncbi:hypothetical protein HK405_004148 [Cladochytrium tenue]|nr:hypothetical protein HK405_004148 [Cladochytrium tenue]
MYCDAAFADAATDDSVGDVSVGAPLPPWTRGFLDIHHIDIGGAGSATLIIGPDRSTFLIDCGASADTDAVAAITDDDSNTTSKALLRPGQRVAHYAMRHSGSSSLDYLIATHVHPDHIGDVYAVDASTAAADDRRGFQLTGLSDVDALMPAATVIDRAYPHYRPLAPLDAPFARNYRAWLDARHRQGHRIEAVSVGSRTQIALRNADAFPTFSIRTLAANGDVWTGAADADAADSTAVRSVFPADLATRPMADQPDENKCSAAFLVAYGRFRYFAGGDLTCDTHDGRHPWLDVETAAAVAAGGPVDVAAANHHGYFDACGPEFVRLLDARTYVVQAWHDTHPGMAQLQRLLADWPGDAPQTYQGGRPDVFATAMTPTSRRVNARFLPKMRSCCGHVVVRVAPGGASYRVIVLDSASENVVAVYGPHRSRGPGSDDEAV